MDLHLTERGAGPRVMFVHGSMTTGAKAWEKQATLAERWTVVVVDRRGYGPNPIAATSDFDVDGDDLAAVINGDVHLVGHSYGALGAMFAAARRPARIRSLTLIEPPALALIRGHPRVVEEIAGHEQLLRDARSPREFYAGFAQRLGAPVDSVPDPLPADLDRQVRLVMHERPPWEAVPPLDELRRGGFPIWVVTGGWDEALEAAADALVAAIGKTARRTVITGRGHVVQRLGAPFNDSLEGFLGTADRS